MSNTDFNSDIDAILAEFSSFSSSFTGSDAPVEEVSETAEAIADIFSAYEEPAPVEIPAVAEEFFAPRVETVFEPVTPAPAEEAEPVYSEPEYRPGFSTPQPVYSGEMFSFAKEPVKAAAPVRTQSAAIRYEEESRASEQVARRTAPAASSKVDFDPSKLGIKNGKRKGAKAEAAPEQSKTKEPKAKEPKVKEPKVKEPKVKKEKEIKIKEVKPQAEPAPESFISKAFKNLIGLVFAGISVFVLCWVVLNVHPDSGTSSSPAAKSSLDIVSDLNVYANNAASDALGDLAYIRKIYTLNETDTVAPKPDAAKFGSTTDPAVVQQVIDSASALLEGQELAWDPNVDFFPGSEIKYYCDDTILVIAWKELIEGKCCTCAEVKIAHGSQLRRKLADNTYGSSVQLKATEMANEVNSVIAINGDFYAFRDLGITAYQRQLYRCNPAQVDSCFFTASGDMLFSYAGELMDAASAQQFIDDNDVTFAIAFGPVLVDNGELRQITSYPIGEIHKTYSRASIGMLDDLHYFLMTINYEGDCTVTSTINQSAQFMYNKGCHKAYALDGGQTSVMVMQGQTVNKVDWGSERIMSDIIYFATAIPEQEVGA